MANGLAADPLLSQGSARYRSPASICRLVGFSRLDKSAGDAGVVFPPTSLRARFASSSIIALASSDTLSTLQPLLDEVAQAMSITYRTRGIG